MSSTTSISRASSAVGCDRARASPSSCRRRLDRVGRGAAAAAAPAAAPPAPARAAAAGPSRAARAPARARVRRGRLGRHEDVGLAPDEPRLAGVAVGVARRVALLRDAHGLGVFAGLVPVERVDVLQRQGHAAQHAVARLVARRPVPLLFRALRLGGLLRRRAAGLVGALEDGAGLLRRRRRLPEELGGRHATRAPAAWSRSTVSWQAATSPECAWRRPRSSTSVKPA